ncbi:MAG: FAD-binding oxidoreductase [Thermoprotei archaeon]
MNELRALGLNVVQEVREDFSGFKAEPLAVVLAESEEDVVKAVRFAYERGIPVVPTGAGTSLSGHISCEGCILIDLSRMRKILELNEVEWYVRVQPGVILEDLFKFVESRGFFLPPDPASFYMCTVGGAIANSSGGMRGLKYGTFREWVLSLRVVLPDGSVVRIGEPFRKNRAGYDLVHLFAGSEGTLGIITEAWLRIIPKPEGELYTVMAVTPDLERAGEVIYSMRKERVLPDLAEFIDDEVVKALNKHFSAGLPETDGGLLFFRGDESVKDRVLRLLQGKAREVLVARGEEGDELLKYRAMGALALKAEAKYVYVEDIVVPISKLIEAIKELKALEAKYNVRMPVIAHIGDGNLHPNILLDRTEDAERLFEEVARLAIRLGGTVSGEHGIGLQKANLMAEQFIARGQERALEIMYGIKRLIDPKGIMNPGKYVERAYTSLKKV